MSDSPRRWIVLAWLCASVAAVAAPTTPNILLIVSDDQGYADAGFQGSTDIPTPHLDRLAESGVRFTSGYASHPLGSPTHAGLLTGRYPQRFGYERDPIYDPNDRREGLSASETILPARLFAAGYVTGWVGKWHLGAAPEFSPARRGFAETYGFFGGGHHYRDWTENAAIEYDGPIVRGGRAVQPPAHLTEAFGREAAAFVRRHAAAPWFLYLAFNAPHTPHEPTPERLARLAEIKDLRRRNYAAQVSLLDDAIGETLTAVAESGQEKRTLVFFFSNSGGAGGSDNTPLRGAKGSVYEGGVRVPFLIAWPGRIEGGRVDHRPVSSLDVFATALAAAEVPMPADHRYDSVNLLPYLTGENSGPPHDRLFWRSGQARAVRIGNWKLVRLPGKQAELYDLARDIGESSDVAWTNPAAQTRLSVALEAWDRELVPPAFNGAGSEGSVASKPAVNP
ncbi:MAG: sulfatase-like hydrolase/transferase [Verrucomicrobia bacterium]|nr:sulfatase-like hydrolase/transferase [Verrucomicrobiota bacterium]